MHELFGRLCDLIKEVMQTTQLEGGTSIGKGGHLCEVALWAQWKHVGSARAIFEPVGGTCRRSGGLGPGA